MQLIKVWENDPLLPRLEDISRDAFPPCEYMPLSDFFPMPPALGVDILAMEEGGRICGFTVLLIMHRCVYIWYLAVAPECRGMGYGSRTLSMLPGLYPGCQIVVDFEAIDPSAPNNDQRIRRTGFYRRCGMQMTTLRLHYMETEFVAAWMGAGEGFDRQGFLSLLDRLHQLLPWFDPVLEDKPIVTDR